jgi:disulfide bond formation protein DsbB
MMSVDAVSTFLSVGALLVAGIVVVTWGLAGASAVGGPNRPIESVRATVAGQGVRLAWLMALVATAGSLYFSEVAHFIPCELCWYQRIAMYPLAVVLGMAAWRRDLGIRRYVLPIAAIGGLVSAYHYLIQHVPDLSGGTCDVGVPCTAAWVWTFEFVSIPFMALASFGAIITLLALDREQAAGQENPT